MQLRRCNRNEMINYIKIYWDNEENKERIPIYSKRNGKQIGRGLGCYIDNKLIGFVFYTPNRHLMGYRKQHPIFKNKNLKIWEINLLEVHPDYRQQGVGSMLVQEIFKRIPKDCVLIVTSHHTDNHFKFYTKNGFIHNKYLKSIYRYNFIRYKMV